MLTFKPYNEYDKIKDSCEADDILREYAELCGEENIGLCFFQGALIIRLFDVQTYTYSFAVVGLEKNFDYKADVFAVREYSVKEETGLIFTDVEPRRLGELLSEFNYGEVCTRDSERTAYTVRILSEADRCGEGIAVCKSPISLLPLTERDIPEYSRLCRDEEGLRFWGYDYREDCKDISDEELYNAQRAEFSRGTSISLGAWYENKFIGDCSFYAFDYKGGAQLSFRLLPEHRGKGLGRALFEAALSAAEELSLTALYAAADKNNKPSVKILSEYMDTDREEDGIIHFVLSSAEL